MLISVLLMMIPIMLAAIRWRWILKALAPDESNLITMRDSICISYIGTFFSCCLPGTVGGDVLRVWLAKSNHIPLPLSIHSVVIDRLIALLALCLMVLTSLPVLGDAAGFNAALVLPVVLTLGMFGLWLLFKIDRILAPVKHIRIVHWLLYFAGSLRMILVKPRAMLVSIAFAIVAHSCYCLSAFILAHSMGIKMTLMQSIIYIPPVILAATLPISIGGWGVREAGVIGMLSLIEVPQVAALMLSIEMGLVTIMASMPGGFVWLFYRKRSPEAIATQ